MRIGVIGIGFVGNAMVQSFMKKNIDTVSFDTFKKIGNYENCLTTDILFLCLPTLFDETTLEYDKSAILETCEKLQQSNYSGTIVIKSTVEPFTTETISSNYPLLQLVHNPEFLTARTAEEDFHKQEHIVLGFSSRCHDKTKMELKKFYSTFYPNSVISLCSSTESESMKIFCNTYYSVKIQFFTELYLLCQKMECDYDRVKELMLKNKWINPMHTTIPGPDGMLSYGGYCFPKDTNALCEFMKRMATPRDVLKNVIEERNSMRPEQFF